MISSIFNPNRKESFNQKFREKRFVFFKSRITGLTNKDRIEILDVGGTESYWERMGFTDNENVFITLLNLNEVQTIRKNFVSVKGDACDMSCFSDKQFDIVFSNSVIEHLFSFENQKKMASEVRRVGRSYYVQTPNFYFPIEPHWLFPFFQFFPKSLRIFLTRYFHLGHYPKAGSIEAATRRVNEVQLLTEKRMKVLFPEGMIYRETFFGMKKSITSYYFP
jgi:hypothetical protein